MLRSAQFIGRCLHEQKRRCKVDLQRPPPRRVGLLVEWNRPTFQAAGSNERRAVHDHIDGGKAFTNPARDILDGITVLEIATEAGGLDGPLRRNSVRRGRASPLIDVHDNDASAKFGKRIGNRETNMTGAAGDDCHAALQRHEFAQRAMSVTHPKNLWNSSEAR